MSELAGAPSAEVLQRAIRIRSLQEGTGTIIDYDSKQYLVTAAHLISDRPEADCKIFLSESWQDFPCRLIASNLDYDVAVLRMPVFFDRRHLPLELDDKNIILGQTISFLGFPFGYYGFAQGGWDEKFPLPFVKKGCIATFHTRGFPHRIVVDGLNNPGFSGGPIVFSHSGKRKVAGIVVGMHEEERFLTYAFKEGHPEKLLYAQNSGLVYGAAASIILRLIDENSGGYSFP
ncbi:serine protease [Pararhodobacter sp. SW119]|uniref:S1 family peptidase n=1 Tax=Pararhodobacter sp. SW119 TaxID=2780075 RepID=UPI001ADFC635